MMAASLSKRDRVATMNADDYASLGKGMSGGSMGMNMTGANFGSRHSNQGSRRGPGGAGNTSNSMRSGPRNNPAYRSGTGGSIVGQVGASIMSGGNNHMRNNPMNKSVDKNAVHKQMGKTMQYN